MQVCMDREFNQLETNSGNILTQLQISNVLYC